MDLWADQEGSPERTTSRVYDSLAGGGVHRPRRQPRRRPRRRPARGAGGAAEVQGGAWHDSHADVLAWLSEGGVSLLRLGGMEVGRRRAGGWALSWITQRV